MTNGESHRECATVSLQPFCGSGIPTDASDVKGERGKRLPICLEDQKCTASLARHSDTAAAAFVIVHDSQDTSLKDRDVLRVTSA